MSLVPSLARTTAELLGRDSWLVSQLRPAYESYLSWSSGGSIPWTINGVAYQVSPRQRHRLGSAYDAPVADFLRERVRPGAVCYDVGANVGVYVMQFAHWSGPSGRVIAFEPNPGARAALAEHIDLNDLEERAEVVAAAVSDSPGEANFYAADADGMSRLGAPNRALAGRAREMKVPVITLDDFCRERGLAPDWLLIDVEGFEIAALRGARELIARRKGALGVVVEMHPNVWESARTTRALAEATLAELGLRPVPLTGQADPLGEYGIVYLSV
jgi:FkbM family methyltransferase